MTQPSIMSRAGFTSDPFATWDSDREELLAEYFVPPPYFPSVLGDPTAPEPTIIFSPRGTGKSALRRMLEVNSTNDSNPYLAIAYMDFEWAGATTPTVEQHQIEIARLLALAILSEIEAEPTEASSHIDDYDKVVLKTATTALLSSLTATQFRAAMGSIKNRHDKASELWAKYGGLVTGIVGALSAAAGLTTSPINAELVSSPTALSAGAKDLLADLVTIARKLAWRSVYVLVDRVDETSATAADPQAAFNVIRSLVTSLPTLEQPGIGFKLFLWDQTEALFRTQGGRPDRVTIKPLRWSVEELSEMLSRRLLTFSGREISSFNNLMSEEAGIDAHALLCYLAHGSPRDMIRLAKHVIAEATRAGDTEAISRSDLMRGIREFSGQRVEELFPRIEVDFSRVPGASFTTPKLASDVFKISVPAMRQKILQWDAIGAVSKVGEQQTGRNRPLHVYAFSDPRILLRNREVADIERYLDTYIIECEGCNEIAIGSEAGLFCSKCNSEVSLQNSRSLLKIVTTP
ncbi:P-loop ATPase, Sll1717 family [Microbacterium sp. A588]